ncbi:MAG: ADP-ribosylglycohydrolase family protein [Planctomycetota bacterium]
MAGAPTRLQRFEGCLLGLAAGDALGAPLEGLPAYEIRTVVPNPRALLTQMPDAGKRIPWAHGMGTPTTLVYTDDTQMAIALAEALCERPGPVAADYAEHYAAHFTEWRGYGRGARAILRCIQDGMEWEQASHLGFKDGSYGNGAAMRIAPLGLRFADASPAMLDVQAEQSALPTHRHPLGIEGAQLIARATAQAAARGPLDPALSRTDFAAEVFGAIGIATCSAQMRPVMEAARDAAAAGFLAQLPTGVAAHESVPTAIACYAAHPGDFAAAVGEAVCLGGDCDTIAAMAGGIAGAHYGIDAVPAQWIDWLEPNNDANGGQGREYLRALAGRLAAVE